MSYLTDAQVAAIRTRYAAGARAVDLAAAYGVPRSTVSNIAHGRRRAAPAPVRGLAPGQRALTEAEVGEIRRRYQIGGGRNRPKWLAAEFGVSSSAICNIGAGRRRRG